MRNVLTTWFAVGCSALEVVVDLAPTSTALPLQYFTPYSEETLKARLKELCKQRGEYNNHFQSG